MKLTEPDFKLLSYIYHDNRESFSKIAKACKLTREQVEYRIQKYLESGLIRKFIPLFNYSKLGYNYFNIIFLKFNTEKEIQQFTEKLSKDKNCISWGKMFSKYDIYLNCIFKNEKELSDYITSNNFSRYFLIKPTFAELYPLKFIKYENKEQITMIDTNEEERKLDNKDKEILNLLSNNGRIRLIDIANKLKISSELALYKLRKLYSDKVIIGSRIQFNMKKLGYYFSAILLNIKLSEQNKLKSFAKQSKHINSLVISLANPNCIIQLFHKEESELRETLEELKRLLPEADIDLIPLNEDEKEVNPLPFLN